MLGIEFKEPKSLKLRIAWKTIHAANKGLFGQMIVVPLMAKHRKTVRHFDERLLADFNRLPINEFSAERLIKAPVRVVGEDPYQHVVVPTSDCSPDSLADQLFAKSMTATFTQDIDGIQFGPIVVAAGPLGATTGECHDLPTFIDGHVHAYLRLLTGLDPLRGALIDRHFVQQLVCHEPSIGRAPTFDLHGGDGQRIVNDGSTDASTTIARQYAVQVIDRALDIIDYNEGQLESLFRRCTTMPIETLVKTEIAQTPQSFRAFMAAFFVGWPPIAQHYTEIFSRVLQSPEYPRWARATALTYDMIFNEPIRHEYRLLKMPVLLVIGQSDRSVFFRRYASPEAIKPLGNWPVLGRDALKELPDGKLIEISDAGHVPHAEKPDEFDAALASYRASFEILERLAAAQSKSPEFNMSDSRTSQNDLSIVHSRIGDVLLKQDKLEDALASYRTSLSIREQAARSERWFPPAPDDAAKLEAKLRSGQQPTVASGQ
jgi:hypothetical protein